MDYFNSDILNFNDKNSHDVSKDQAHGHTKCSPNAIKIHC